MRAINKERFGAFVAQKRKESGLTQKELAERLFLSDKAISKWERGLSLPDMAVLQPLSECLGVSLAELLNGGPVHEADTDALLRQALDLGREEESARKQARKKWRIAFALALAMGAAGTAALFALVPWEELFSSVLVVEGLCALFGVWAVFLAKERLPAYYENNKISYVAQGPFRLHIVGIRFNQSNWPHVLNGLRAWLLGAMAACPPLWYSVYVLTPPEYRYYAGLAVTLLCTLGLFIPAVVLAKKYE